MPDPHERDLEEVERALSVLGGRHPEQVRAERLAAEAAAKRRREHEESAAAMRRVAWKRRVISIVVIGACAIVLFFVWRVVAAQNRADAEIAPLVARYTALGFDALPRSTFAPQNRASVTTVAGDCYAFVATNGAEIHVERATSSSNANGEIVVCTCASESIHASANAIVRALHIAGGALGGKRAAAFRFGDRGPTIAVDDACADEMLATYAREKKYPKQEADDAWLASHPSLTASGFSTVVSAPSSRAYAFVESQAPRCFIASGVTRDELTLWSLDAQIQKPIEHAKSAIAWCAVKNATFVVEHGNSGAIVVVAAPTARVGGMLGLREIARAENLSIVTWTREDERGALAIDTLRASVVPDPIAAGCESINPAGTQNARVVFFSTAFSTSDLDFRCEPALGASSESVCVQARALAWHAPPPTNPDAATCVVAYGALPYWMSAIGDSRDASQALDAELALIGFARRLTARGFFPGVIEGVTEKSDSVEILGRSGDDAIVAVGLWPAPPFIHPYSDDAPWKLEGEPRIIPVKGGDRVTLRTQKNDFAVPIDKRRTVVFRHSTQQAIH